MAFQRLLFIVLFCFLIAKSENTNKGAGENPESASQVASVLDYLNSNSNGIYEYKSGSLSSAQKKADIIEVTVDVDVDCLKTYPEIPCNERVLVCHAFIGQNPDQMYQVLSDVKCTPKIDIILEEMEEIKNVSPLMFAEQNQREMEKIDLSSEALSPAQGDADFVAVHKANGPCLGCPFDLNTDAEGIEELINTAVKHIESERSQRHKIVNIRRLQQQVVAGLKYILLAEVAPTMCDKDADLSAPCILDTSVQPFICEITFIQKPWISRSKHVIKNNCTISQEFEPLDLSKRDDINNEILPGADFSNPMPQDTPKPVPNYEAMAQTGHMEDDMDAARLADLESQILFGGMFESPKVTKVEHSPVNVMPNTVAQPEYVSVEEPTPLIIDNEDDLKVEPLINEQEPLYRMPIFGSVPVVDESEPVVTMYVHQNDEPLRASDENTVIKTTDGESVDFESNSQVEDRLRRELKGDSESESDSNSSESKEKAQAKTIKHVSNELVTTTASSAVETVRRELADTSEESSESNDSSKEKRQRVRRETNNTSEESNDSSREKLIGIRQAKKPSEESSESNDSSKEKHIVKRETENTSEENSKSSKSTEERNVKRPKRANDKNNDSSSSSSSSSSSDDDDNKDDNKKDDNNRHDNDIDVNTRKPKSEKIKNDNNNNDSSSSSSSSSSSDDDDNNKNRHRRSIGQMEKISSDEKVIVRDLADFAAATLDNIDDDHHKRVILQILGAKKLKLDGIYYQIILRLGISHCHENEHNENCREKLQTNLTKICKVQVHVEDDYSNPKVVKSQCQNIKKDENDRNRTNYSRYRRSVLVGGHSPRSTDDPDIKRFVSATLDHLDSTSNQTNKHKAVEIISATSQVVAGARYIITVKIGVSDCAKSENKQLETCGLLQGSEPETCTIDVWERVWLPKTIYRVKCEDSDFRFGDVEEENTRNKREVRLVGAPRDIATDSEEVLGHLQRSLIHLDSKSDHENKYVVDEVLSASRQVVAGSLTRIRARVALSDCKKGSESRNCTKLDDTRNQATVCKFKIWEQPWLHFIQTNVTCDDHQEHSFRRKRSIDKLNRQELLAPTNISTDSKRLLGHLQRSLIFLDSRSDHENKYVVDEVLSATQQENATVSITRIRVRAVLSDCKKGSDSRNCTKLDDTHNRATICNITVWIDSWIHNRETFVSCDNHHYSFLRRKRSIDEVNRPQLLAPTNISTDSEEVLGHLQRSLDYLDSKSNHENKYVVDEVLSATQQDVYPGTVTKIRARVALSDCKKGPNTGNCTKLDDALNQATICNVTVTIQPWAHFRGTDVTCDDNQYYSFRRKRSVEELNRPQLLGADEELSTDLFEAKKFIRMALEYIQSKSEISGKYELRTVNSVSRRIVAGTLWTIAADIALCRQVDLLRSSYSMCPDASQYKHCQFRVLDQPWQANGLTINVTCDNDEQVYSYTPISGVNEGMLSSFDHEKAFTRFLRKYNKVYEEVEYNHRLKVFRDNVNKIALLNKYEKGSAQYGFTQFADLTEKEFSQLHGYRPELRRNDNELPFAQAHIPNIELPKEFDWRTKGAVTPVKNQGLCGSCWAFSVTGNVEGQYAIKHGKLLEFSEQELVDCDKVDQGCNGGLMDNAYRVIEKLGGLETESDYPYEGDDETCHFNPAKVSVQLTGALNISHNETDMAKWLVQNGPISIAINANAMQFYMGGVSHPWKMLCNPNNLDHGVLIVGYGVHKYTLFNKTLPYWIVKNSWTTSWGEQGYYRVYRGDGTCGLNQTPSSAIVA